MGKPIGLLNRWHLYDAEVNRFTVIPGEDSVILWGRFNESKGINSLEAKRLSFFEYESFKDTNNLIEVRL